jgi:hypothetical protein
MLPTRAPTGVHPCSCTLLIFLLRMTTESCSIDVLRFGLGMTTLIGKTKEQTPIWTTCAISALASGCLAFSVCIQRLHSAFAFSVCIQRSNGKRLLIQRVVQSPGCEYLRFVIWTAGIRISSGQPTAEPFKMLGMGRFGAFLDQRCNIELSPILSEV